MLPVVFIGPTLSREEAAAILIADYRPPAAMGDVWRAARDYPPAIGIVDGYFHSVPSVWHKEILWAISEGVPVYGAASMGALRASELHTLGMVGIGRIYEDYASGKIEDDDEVAVVHADASCGYRPVSEPMVNIRATLFQAARESIIPMELRVRLESIAKTKYFAERIWSSILGLALEEGCDGTALRTFKEWLGDNRVDQKRDDAIALLEAMKTGPESRPPRFHFKDTVLWRSLVVRVAAEDQRAVLEELKLEPLLFERITRDAGTSPASVATALQREGIYERMLQQSRRKATLAYEAPQVEIPEYEALVRWFFEERLGGWPDDLPVFLSERGWISDQILSGVAEREFRILQRT